MNKVELSAEFSSAVRALKRSIGMLISMDAVDAAAAIIVKVIDALEALSKSDVSKSVSDLWACSFVINRVIYNAISENLGKNSDHATAAGCLAKECKFKEAYEQYMIANSEIAKDTGFAVIFMEQKS